MPAAKPHRLRDAMRPARIASAKNAPQAPQAAAAPFRHRRARDPAVQVMVHRPARHPSRRGRRQHTRRRRIFPGVGRGVAGPMRFRRTASSAQKAKATRHSFTGSSGPSSRGLKTDRTRPRARHPVKRPGVKRCRRWIPPSSLPPTFRSAGPRRRARRTEASFHNPADRPPASSPPPPSSPLETPRRPP